MSLPVLPVAGRRAYPPRVSAFTARFWSCLAEGRFETTECARCARATFPPKPLCPHCWSGEMRWRSLSGRGRLYSASVVHAAPAAFRHEAPYGIGIVDLDEGLRIATRLVGPSIALGERVEIVVLRYEDGPLFGARAAPP